ncbi:MAG: hypothetical protein JKP90_08435 [Desulfofustis sp. PB-SRB1]|jgi:AraC-like DNA-binding protein|nr:hypothetical protein [Desulfofustis sp. PB-SRB1]
MNNLIADEVRSLGGEPTDDVWLWLLERGPHGEDFSWSQRKNKPPGYVGVEHLQQIVQERNANDSSFSERAREAVTLALRADNPVILRRGIQVAAVVGGEPELVAVVGLAQSEIQKVAADAKASAFYLKRRLKAETSGQSA